MAADVKFCGLTREEDARFAGELGASYTGVILAGGPRHLPLDRARQVLDAAHGPKRVGVFGRATADEVADQAGVLGLDVVQLHADPTVSDVVALRARFAGEVWAVLRLAAAALPAHASELADAADAVVLDRHSTGALGGTGQVLPWEELAGSLGMIRQRARIVLAGGLHHGNVHEALRHVVPDIVDVSSGVESAPGIKDHQKMRAFAARAASREEA